MAVSKNKAPKPLLRLQGSGLRSGERVLFPDVYWTWQQGEQWAILGPNGSGKSMLALALAGKIPVLGGQIDYGFRHPDDLPENAVALLTPSTHRALLAQESSFYQSRWHSGVEEGQRTAADLISQSSVEGANPFEVAPPKEGRREFEKRQRQLVTLLGLKPLLRRKVLHLSNGEQRKVLLAFTLLRSPQLLILDDPFAGLDIATRSRLRVAIEKLMRGGLPILLAVNRPDELPRTVTHVLLVRNGRVLGQGPRGAMLSGEKGGGRLPHSKTWRTNTPALESRGSVLECGTPVPLCRETVRRKGSKVPLASKNSEKRHRREILNFENAQIRVGGKTLLPDFSWRVQAGERWALLGPNGAGKTTLLSLIQMDNPLVYAIDMRIFGQRLQSTQGIWQARQQMGWLSPELHLHYPRQWSCWQVVCSGFFNSVGLYQHCTTRQRSAARFCLAQMGLADFLNHPLGELSLGDQRLVLLARAMVKKPRLLILDEPCQGLDAEHRHRVLNIVDKVMSRNGGTLIFVSHHPKEMPACISHILRLKGGGLSKKTTGIHR